MQYTTSGGYCSACGTWPCRCSVTISSVWQPPDFVDRRHDEVLRLQCLREAYSHIRLGANYYPAMMGGWSEGTNIGLLDDSVLELARALFLELTGRAWPTWSAQDR